MELNAYVICLLEDSMLESLQPFLKAIFEMLLTGKLKSQLIAHLQSSIAKDLAHCIC